MNLLNQIGQRLTDVGQNVSQQTKNLTDVAKLNAEIAERRRQLPALYEELGKIYYQRHQNDTAADGFESIRKITSLQEEIEKRELEVKQIKGVVQCERCGADVPFNASFCNHCGAPVKQRIQYTPQAADGRTCANCGNIIPDGNIFCTYCGTRVEPEASEQSLHEAVEQPSEGRTEGSVENTEVTERAGVSS